jgi:hypothetical protein
MRKIMNFRGNLLVLIGLSAFALFGIFGVPGGAQTMRSTKATPTPKKTVKATPKGMAPKKSPASTRPTPKPTTAKATPKPTPRTTPKPAESPQVIVSVTSARLRSEPSTSSETVQYLKIGAVYPVLDQNTGWYRIRAGSEKTGWISNTVSQPFTTAKRGEIYAGIAAKYSKQALDFTTASQLYDFLTTAEKQITNRRQQGEIGFKRLLALQAALKKVPYDKQDQEPYKTFLKGKDKEVIYSDPSAEYYVISELFWDLHDKNKGTPIGEDIAWTASQNSLPGECEGYINCYLHNLRVTYGEYLNFYPAGKNSKKALTELGVFLGPIVADSREKSVYSGPADISDRAEFNKLLTELRAIISRSPYTEKTKPLQQIKTLAEAYR